MSGLSFGVAERVVVESYDAATGDKSTEKLAVDVNTDPHWRDNRLLPDECLHVISNQKHAADSLRTTSLIVLLHLQEGLERLASVVQHAASVDGSGIGTAKTGDMVQEAARVAEMLRSYLTSRGAFLATPTEKAAVEFAHQAKSHQELWFTVNVPANPNASFSTERWSRNDR